MAPNGKPPSASAAKAFESAFAGMQDAMTRGESQIQASLEAFSTESRAFFEDMSKDAAAAFEQFKTCKSPMDALMVEQDWFAKRAKAYLNYGLHIVQTITPKPVEAAPPPAPSAKAPDASKAA